MEGLTVHDDIEKIKPRGLLAANEVSCHQTLIVQWIENEIIKCDVTQVCNLEWFYMLKSMYINLLNDC